MTLQEYIDFKGINRAQLARELEVSRACTSHWLNSNRHPRPSMMKRIIKWSENKVDANSFHQ